MVLPHCLRSFLPSRGSERSLISCVMRFVLCGFRSLLAFSLFVVHLGRLGIYFDDSEQNRMEHRSFIAFVRTAHWHRGFAVLI
jgi:hypothetical protein